jgi:hypothetical protein
MSSIFEVMYSGVSLHKNLFFLLTLCHFLIFFLMFLSQRGSPSIAKAYLQLGIIYFGMQQNLSVF